MEKHPPAPVSLCASFTATPHYKPFPASHRSALAWCVLSRHGLHV